LLEVVDPQTFLEVGYLTQYLKISVRAKLLVLFPCKRLTHCGKIFG